MRFIFIFLFGFALAACQSETQTPSPTNKALFFFNLKDFFQKEITRLESINSFKKTVQINELQEEKTIQNLNLEEELSVFIASDINKPAWSDKYKIDSIFANQNQLKQINYSALRPNLKTKKISIDFSNNVVSNIIIEKSIDNAIAQSKQILTYTVAEGFSIQSKQTLRLSDPKDILVKVEFIGN